MLGKQKNEVHPKSSSYENKWYYALCKSPLINVIHLEISMKYIPSLLSCILLSFSFNIQASPNYWVKHSGDRMNIIKQGNFSGTIDLQDLENIDHLFAVGPLEGLKGEITISNIAPAIKHVNYAA